MPSSFDIEAVRKHFPGLNQPQVFFDNAGGSQVLRSVVDSISSYLLNTNVQLGASYPVSVKSTNLYYDGYKAAAKYINAPSVDSVVCGASTTQLMRNLSVALGNSFPPDSELILSKLDHEANLAGWVQLAKWKGLTVKWWAPASPTSNPQLQVSDLKPLLSAKTKIVACTHTSNLLGTIVDIPTIAELVHTVPGAMLAVDAVAYAPHRPIDVQALGVDFYAFSWYKVYGPHVSMLYAAPHTHSKIQSLGHFFKPDVGMENKLGLGGANYELVQSIPKIIEYVESITWPAIIAQENKLQSILLEYLNSRFDTTVYGETSPDGKKRVPVISFGVKGRSSGKIVEGIEKKSMFGCRSGDMYSKRLVDEVLCSPKEMQGPVRVSLLHYNTEQEVKDYVKILDEVLGEMGGT